MLPAYVVVPSKPLVNVDAVMVYSSSKEEIQFPTGNPSNSVLLLLGSLQPINATPIARHHMKSNALAAMLFFEREIE
jgi:hypothetical protein